MLFFFVSPSHSQWICNCNWNDFRIRIKNTHAYRKSLLQGKEPVTMKSIQNTPINSNPPMLPLITRFSSGSGSNSPKFRLTPRWRMASHLDNSGDNVTGFAEPMNRVVDERLAGLLKVADDERPVTNVASLAPTEQNPCPLTPQNLALTPLFKTLSRLNLKPRPKKASQGSFEYKDFSQRSLSVLRLFKSDPKKSDFTPYQRWGAVCHMSYFRGTDTLLLILEKESCQADHGRVDAKREHT